MAASSPEPPSKTAQVKAELRYMARAFVPAFGVTMLVFSLGYALIVAFGETDPDAPSKLLLIPAAFIYGLFVGVWPGLLVGGTRLGFALVGRWTLFPLVVIPAAVGLALWASSGLLASLATDIWDAVLTAGAEREWLAASVGKAAHAGPLILVILLPLLLVDLGALALNPQVLWAMVVFLFTFVVVVGLAVVPTVIVSMIVLLRAYVVRLRERIEARRAQPQLR